MSNERAYTEAFNRLRDANLRTTRQRLALCKLLFAEGDRHVTAESLHAEATQAGVKVAVATIYNTLRQFTEAGLLREVVVENGKTYFDTNTSNHHHFYVEDDGRLLDIDGAEVVVEGLPAAPHGTEVSRVDVVVRVSSASK